MCTNDTKTACVTGTACLDAEGAAVTATTTGDHKCYWPEDGACTEATKANCSPLFPECTSDKCAAATTEEEEEDDEEEGGSGGSGGSGSGSDEEEDGEDSGDDSTDSGLLLTVSVLLASILAL